MSYWRIRHTITWNAKVCKMQGNNWKIYRGKCTTRYLSEILYVFNYLSQQIKNCFVNNHVTLTIYETLIVVHIPVSFQVSETENLRKNLAVERMIVEGCDILLDVNQVFVRQGEQFYLLTIMPHIH